MSERLILHCAQLSDRDLVRTLTVDREAHDKTFLNIAEAERDKRNLSVPDFINAVHLAHNDDEGESCTIEHALAQLHSDIPLWSILTLTNSLDDAWVIQREYNRWLVHHYCEDTYQTSFFYLSLDQLKSTLKKFLSLESWTPETPHDLNTWKSIFQTRSPAYLTKIVSDLGDTLLTVQTPIFSNDQKGQLTLLVPPDEVDHAQNVVARTQDKLAQLYDQAEHFADHNDREQELKIYNLLAELVPDNLAVYYNRGSVLLELDRSDEAAESFLEALVLGMPEIKNKLDLKPQRTPLGGIAGGVNPLIGLVVLSQQNSSPQPLAYPDYFDDIECFLLQIQAQRPQNTRVLHGLAIIAECQNKIAAAIVHYRDLLVIDPNDQTAQTQLAYLQQTDEL